VPGIGQKIPPFVVFHAGCYDGFATYWACSRSLDDVEVVSYDHGDPPPDVRLLTERDVHVLDFCFPRAVLERIALACRPAPLTVLDHHKTAQPELVVPGTGLFDFRFDPTKSAGRLAWQHFHPGKLVPWLVVSIKDRDLWANKLPHSCEINAWRRSYRPNFDEWDGFNNVPQGGATWNEFIVEGSAILRAEALQVEAAAWNAQEDLLDGEGVPCVNTTVLMSEIGEYLAAGRPFSATFLTRPDGRQVWSLRSDRAGRDVRVIAKQHGGGGHKHAAGFLLERVADYFPFPLAAFVEAGSLEECLAPAEWRLGRSGR
jgi:hypothetical protein